MKRIPLFIKKEFLDLILSGVKTLEIRCGPYYNRVKPDRALLFNYKYDVACTAVEQFDSCQAMMDALEGRWSLLGRAKALSKPSIEQRYASCEGPWFIITVAREGESEV